MENIKQINMRISALLITAVLLSTSLVFSNEVTFTGMVQMGIPVHLLPIITPSNTANAAVKFSSNIPSVASVDSLTGGVTGKSSGSATITATTVDGNFILKHSVGSLPHNGEVDVPLNYADDYIEVFNRLKENKL